MQECVELFEAPSSKRVRRVERDEHDDFGRGTDAHASVPASSGAWRCRYVVAEPAKAFGARHGVVNAKLLEEAFVVLLALKQLGVHSNQPRNYDSAVRVCVVLAVQRGLCHPKGQAPDWVSAMRCVAGYADVNPARLMAWRDHVALLRAALVSVSAEDVHELCEDALQAT